MRAPAIALGSCRILNIEQAGPRTGVRINHKILRKVTLQTERLR